MQAAVGAETAEPQGEAKHDDAPTALPAGQPRDTLSTKQLLSAWNPSRDLRTTLNVVGAVSRMKMNLLASKEALEPYGMPLPLNNVELFAAQPLSPHGGKRDRRRSAANAAPAREHGEAVAAEGPLCNDIQHWMCAVM